MPDNRNGFLYAGLAVAAVAAGWWLIGRRQNGEFISQTQAEAFALSWALSYQASSGLTLSGRTRTVFFAGKPPRMPLSDWQLVGGTPTRAFYYVEFDFGRNEFGQAEFLTVMIDAVTGEKPPVSQGWVAGTLFHNFGL